MTSHSVPIISAMQLTKRLPRDNRSHRSLRTLLFTPGAFVAAVSRGDRLILDNLNFDIHRSERIGIISANGGGKTTLLKLFAGILLPNQGTIRTTGSVFSLLDAGAPFLPDLSGRENIILCGVLSGANRDQMTALTEDIASYAGVSHLLDDTIRTYSTGSAMRLALSIGLHLEPALLLLDESLISIDKQFREQYVTSLHTLSEQGTTIIITSHDETILQHFCTRLIWLQDRRIHMEGEPVEILKAYHESSSS